MKCMLEMSMQAKFQRSLKSPWVLKIMPQNTPTAYEELKIYACEALF